MISVQLWLPLYICNTDALTPRLQFSLMMQAPCFILMTNLKLPPSFRKTIKPTSVHCEERKTIKIEAHSDTPLAQQTGWDRPGYVHLFGGAREPITTLPFLNWYGSCRLETFCLLLCTVWRRLLPAFTGKINLCVIYLVVDPPAGSLSCAERGNEPGDEANCHLQ